MIDKDWKPWAPWYKDEDSVATEDVAEPTKTTGPPELHLYWPSEFPIALCGHVSQEDSMRVPSTHERANTCGKCLKIMASSGRYERPRGGA